MITITGKFSNGRRFERTFQRRADAQSWLDFRYMNGSTSVEEWRRMTEIIGELDGEGKPLLLPPPLQLPFEKLP